MAKESREHNRKINPLGDAWDRPHGVEWKSVGGNAAMVPDRGFRKQLHTLDPELEVVWDWGWKKWEIWRFPKDGTEPFCCMVVQTKGRTYRELGADVLLQLQAGDPIRFTKQQLYAYFEELDRQVARRKAQEFINRIEAITLDTFNYARGVLQVQVPRKYRIINAITLRN